ncbi:MAG: response regulator [Candidatus Pacebacteria bacterium]|nr:response regulator [Candidatus Paceibacterota bacterium]MBP9842656.1 response regulator [Candidatus Paceibacterota bacterium]
MKLLLVDDDAFLRDMYATKFAECGHVIDAADSAVMALQKIQQDQSFDVVLLDMIMPGMGGVELIATIRERFPELKAKYIVLSNQGQAEDIEEAKEVGADGYIIKAESIPSDVVKKVEALAKKN